ncbi:glycosyltransferase [Actinoplanes flavus]|uniref:Glycosyltransferase n=1 Tax=Actinoplanes flavus TaxID=2820290 RepID=A0ABS3UQF2_9ACTN|nr:glycosyltransferase [Actinoplanes flavus]MBO3741014.1 glycosyltransferase [Actinoplanes flavus]
MFPRLSIVVPFYGVERYLAACLDSLARQTFRDFEVVLVDDGSPDGSAEIARAFCAADPRFRLVTSENQGLGPARNLGVEHAQGEYLTFVDSDDLVPRHAYEMLIRSLDRTSSSLAGGNARRFNNTAGVRQSYVHRFAFAADRPATHVLEFPELAIDRMVWNKVYRRRFWDQFGYRFPAIRYEDYPVTLEAHLDAVTVDCLAAPTYYWRERESGESITQQRFVFGNLEDRVVSAEMVLDMVDRRAPELRPTVHHHLAQIDLTTVVQAFAAAAGPEVPALLGLGRRLTGRLDEQVLERIPAFQRLEYHALRSGDVELLQRLARFRADGGLAAGVRADRHPILPWRYRSAYPGSRDAAGVPAGVYRLAPKELALRASATHLEWADDALVLRGTAEILHMPASADASLRLTLVTGLRATPLPVRRIPAPDGEQRVTGFEARVPRDMLAAIPRQRGSARLMASMRSGTVRRRGLLGLQTLYPVGARIGDAWFQPARAPDGRMQLRRLSGDAELTGAAADGDTLVLTGRAPTGPAAPELLLSRAARDVRVPLETGPDGTFTARIPVREVVDATSPDDPFLGRTLLIPQIGDSLLLVTGLSAAVAVPWGDRVLSIARSPGQYLNLVEGPARVTASGITVDGDVITVSGPRWDGVDYRGIVWRRFRPNSDDAVDAACAVTVDGDRWTARLDSTALEPAGEADWTLFADGYAVQAETFALTGLPRRLARHRLHTRAGTLHLETS